MSDDNAGEAVVATSEVDASNESKTNSDNKDIVKEDSVQALKEIEKEKVSNVMNGDKDNGNSMDSISNGHDETSNGDDIEATSDGELEEGEVKRASNGDDEGDDMSDLDDGEEASNGAIEISESSTPMVSEPTSPQRSSNKRKEPQVVRIDEGDDDSQNTEDVEDEDMEEEEELDEEEEEGEVGSEGEEDEVQEVKDDSSDSDIMEVEAEDPLAGSSSVTISSSVTSTEVKKPQVVTIDDPKTLQALASSAKSKVDREKVTIIDTSAILSGRATSGVTITPSRAPGLKHVEAKTPSPALPVLNSKLTSTLAASGVTISSKAGTLNTPLNSPVIPPGTTPISGSGFVYDSKGQLQDPNLTDDTIVIEAPSFIVPYVYEKPPREPMADFKTEIKKLMDELKKKESEELEKKKKEKEEKEKDKPKTPKKDKKKKAGRKAKKSTKDDGSGEEDNGERSEDDDYNSAEDLEDDASDSDDSDIAEVRAKSPELPEVKPVQANFFESSLGKFITDLGMNLVQEAVQKDLLKQQQKKAMKEKSAAVMHAIASLKHNIEQSKENNQAFQLTQHRCKHCSFRTESDLAMAHHMETPHMRHGMYRCNYCHFETKLAHEVVGHMQGFHEVKPRLERAPSIHQCPQCPFEDMMKGKLTRHKVGCDKRFKIERNQEPPHDWDPPAKIPKPPTNSRGVAGVSLLAQGRHHQNLAAVRGALTQFNQQGGRGPYSAMPALQFGPGRGRPPSFNKPFIPNVTRNIQPRTILPAFGQAARLAGNPSVTIQSISKTGGIKSNNPSISITPVPGARNVAASPGLKPGAPSTGGGKDNFVICEICDGYIRDLEQLRNHMQFIHKVKIHPKMIYNRPPLNCQKCQFRFFTDQGLERHLLGSHGLVTASMQDLANKGQDSGRCPVCGKMFHWKLLNHVAKDHMKTLKPAHLSYKCTVCTATFGQYKLFETHVYSAHSGGRKNAPNKPGPKPASTLPAKTGKPFKMSDEITIIPQGRNAQKTPTTTNKPAPKKKETPKVVDDDIIEIDDEEEIDDVEEENDKKKNGNQSRKRKADDDDTEDSANAKSNKTSANNSAAEEAEETAEESEKPEEEAEESGEEGVEEIRDDEPEEDD